MTPAAHIAAALRLLTDTLPSPRDEDERASVAKMREHLVMALDGLGIELHLPPSHPLPMGAPPVSETPTESDEAAYDAYCRQQGWEPEPPRDDFRRHF